MPPPTTKMVSELAMGVDMGWAVVGLLCTVRRGRGAGDDGGSILHGAAGPDTRCGGGCDEFSNSGIDGVNRARPAAAGANLPHRHARSLLSGRSAFMLPGENAKKKRKKFKKPLQCEIFEYNPRPLDGAGAQSMLFYNRIQADCVGASIRRNLSSRGSRRF